MIDTTNITGIQHVGFPVKDIERTLAFYNGLGFETVHRTAAPDGTPVGFLKLGNCVLEVYRDPCPPCKAGAVDHFSLDVRNIDRVYEEVKEAGYPITTRGIEELPFWEKGVRFFKTEGPDKESVEFCEIVK